MPRSWVISPPCPSLATGTSPPARTSWACLLATRARPPTTLPFPGKCKPSVFRTGQSKRNRQTKKASLWVASGLCGCQSLSYLDCGLVLGGAGCCLGSDSGTMGGEQGPFSEHLLCLSTCRLFTCCLVHRFLTTVLRGALHYPHFTDEQTEAHDFLDATLHPRARARI